MILAAGDVTDLLSIDLTTIIATLLNTLILFLVIKHFLFDKVNKVIDDRKNEVAETYKQADEANENAKKLEAEYNQKIMGAKEESAEIIQSATRKAQQRSDEI
ncbi:MAG: ATP synthase F0 subunit B, partial [Hominimerdicola sp.]